MDFSNLKKIFYIVAIISMLLSIKSKVLGASGITLNSVIRSSATSSSDTYTAILPDFLNDSYWVIRQVNTNNGWDTKLFYSDSPFYLTTNSTQGTFSQFVYSYNLTFSGNEDTYTYTFTNGDGVSIRGDVQLSNSWVNSSSFSWVYGNFDFYMNGELANVQNIIPKVKYPFFDNVTEIENGNPDGVYISPEDYSRNDNLYFHLLQIDTGLSNSDTSIYYYSDKTFILNKDSEYFKTWADPNIDGYYYYIPRYKLGLSQNTSYLYVLNNSENQINNSFGIYSKDEANGIFDVVQSDTAGVITATEEESDRMKNIEQSLVQNQETTNNINDTLSNTTVSEETETDINGSLNFNNQNDGLNSLNNGFFTRLTSLLSDIVGYNLAEDTSISIPLPNSEDNLILHSIDIHNNVTGALRLIINAFWVYIFTFYLWRFINKIYIAVSTGHILDTFSSNGEAITNDML